MTREKASGSKNMLKKEKEEISNFISLKSPIFLNALQKGYEIKVKDHFDSHWYESFEGWVITNLDNGEVTLNRYPADQSALFGALTKIRDLNLLLISVTLISGVLNPSKD